MSCDCHCQLHDGIEIESIVNLFERACSTVFTMSPNQRGVVMQIPKLRVIQDSNCDLSDSS